MRRRAANRDTDPLALDEETVERLLTGELDPAQAPPGAADVAALLAATVAAPSDEELAGKEAALAELRAVTRARAAATSRSARPVRGRRRIGLAAVVVVGALVTGGVAAATGRLPDPVREASRRILGTDGAEPATPGARPVPGTPSPGTGRGGQQPTTTGAIGAGPGTTGAAPASPNLTGLCRAYLAGKGAGNGKMLDATAFQALARAAGGEAKVEAWCQARLANPEPEASKPGKPKPKDQQPPAPPDDPGQGQGGPPPSNGGQGGSPTQAASH